MLIFSIQNRIKSSWLYEIAFFFLNINFLEQSFAMADRVDNGKKSLRKRHAHKKFFGQQLNWRLMAAIPNMQYNQASASLLFAHLYATIQQKSRHKKYNYKKLPRFDELCSFLPCDWSMVCQVAN